MVGTLSRSDIVSRLSPGSTWIAAKALCQQPLRFGKHLWKGGAGKRNAAVVQTLRRLMARAPCRTAAADILPQNLAQQMDAQVIITFMVINSSN